jgi:hypothetical protein
MPLDELARQRSVGFGSRSIRGVFQNRLPKARRLAQAHTPRDHGLVNTFAEMLAYLSDHLLAKICSAVVHSHDDAA